MFPFFCVDWNLRRHPQVNATQTCRQHGCVRALMWEPKLKYACKAPVAPCLWLTHPQGAITCTDAMNSGALEGTRAGGGGGGGEELEFLRKASKLFFHHLSCYFTLQVSLFLWLQRWKVTQFQHGLSQPRKRKAAFSPPQGAHCGYLFTFLIRGGDELQGWNVDIFYLKQNLPWWNGPDMLGRCVRSSNVSEW